jgi:hypothetical protein
MQQHETKASKRQLWSVYVFVERQVQEGRSMLRRKRLSQKQPYRRLAGTTEIVLHEFLYLNVTKMHKKNGILYIQIGMGKSKEIHRHDMKSVVSIQVREHDRSGRIQ